MTEKKLTRSSKDKIIAGVCGGLSEYFGIDPMVMRLIFIVAAFFMGTTFWIYLILWLILPLDTDTTASGSSDVLSSNVEEMKNKADEVVKAVEKGLSGDSSK